MKKFKEFLNMFNIFELNLSSKSYKSAAIRIAVSLLTLLAVCVFRFSITITDMTLNIFLTIFLLGIMVLCILCFFVAAVECLQVGDNIKKEKERQNNYK